MIAIKIEHNDFHFIIEVWIVFVAVCVYLI